MPTLLRRERHAGEEPAHLGGIVMCDGGLEALARRKRLSELTS